MASAAPLGSGAALMWGMVGSVVASVQRRRPHKNRGHGELLVVTARRTFRRRKLSSIDGVRV